MRGYIFGCKNMGVGDGRTIFSIQYMRDKYSWQYISGYTMLQPQLQCVAFFHSYSKFYLSFVVVVRGKIYYFK